MDAESLMLLVRSAKLEMGEGLRAGTARGAGSGTETEMWLCSSSGLKPEAAGVMLPLWPVETIGVAVAVVVLVAVVVVDAAVVVAFASYMLSHPGHA